MKLENCPDCGEKLHEIFNQDYVDKFDTCWNCDKERWDFGDMTTGEFEAREESVAKQHKS